MTTRQALSHLGTMCEHSQVGVMGGFSCFPYPAVNAALDIFPFSSFLIGLFDWNHFIGDGKMQPSLNLPKLSLSFLAMAENWTKRGEKKEEKRKKEKDAQLSFTVFIDPHLRFSLCKSVTVAFPSHFNRTLY